MNAHTFFELVHTLKDYGLCDSREGLSVERQVLQFMRIACNHTFQDVGDRYSCSTQTVSTYFHKVLQALLKLAADNIKLPAATELQPGITDDPKFSPWFDAVYGCVDGTHIPIWVPVKDRAAYRNYKTSTITQNVMAMCSLDMRFLYVLAGWEGSASDSRIMSEMIRDGEFLVPPGRFILADAGFAASPTCIIPYRCVRYHLREWLAGSSR
jgi:hypothetical protein